MKKRTYFFKRDLRFTGIVFLCCMVIGSHEAIAMSGLKRKAQSAMQKEKSKRQQSEDTMHLLARAANQLTENGLDFLASAANQSAASDQLNNQPVNNQPEVIEHNAQAAPAAQIYRCPILDCKKRCDSLLDLQVHSDEHTYQQLYGCYYCDRLAKEDLTIINHQQEFHANLPICSRISAPEKVKIIGMSSAAFDQLKRYNGNMALLRGYPLPIGYYQSLIAER